jgi:hypothetical protein
MGKKSNTAAKKAKRVTKKNKGYRAPGGGKRTLDLHPTPTNPFELKVNKRKHETLGRVKKHETGRPLLTKLRAIQHVSPLNQGPGPELKSVFGAQSQLAQFSLSFLFWV